MPTVKGRTESQANWTSNFENKLLTSVKGDGATKGEILASAFLSPLRYFAGGRKVEISSKQVDNLQEATFSQSHTGRNKTTWKTIKMAIAIIPGFLIGTTTLLINSLIQNKERAIIIQEGIIGQTTKMKSTEKLSTQETNGKVVPTDTEFDDGQNTECYPYSEDDSDYDANDGFIPFEEDDTSDEIKA